MRAGKLGALKLMRSATARRARLGVAAAGLRRPDARTHSAAPRSTEGDRRDRGRAGRHRRAAHGRRRSRARVNEKMVHRHAEYVRDLKIEALREAAGPETPATQRRLDDLRALDERRLNSTALDALRPKTLAGIVGQEAAIRALLGEAGLAVSAARDPLRSARRRQDDRRAARARTGEEARAHAVRRRARRSSRRAARRCAGTIAKRRTRCWAACTTRSTRAAGAISPRAAFPSRSSAS